MANNTVSINKIVSIFQDLSIRQEMVNDFGYGPAYNIGTSREMKFPYIWVENGTGTTQRSDNGFKTNLYTFTIYCMDKINFGEDNYNEIISDTHYILDTMVQEIAQHKYYVDMNLSIDGDIQFTPVIEATDDNVNGWQIDITIKQPIRYTYCNSPIEPITQYTTQLNNQFIEYRLIGPTGPTGPAGATGADGQGAIGNNDVGVMYLKNNTITTDITAINQRKVVSGTMSVGTLYNFIKDPSTNSLKYTGPGGRFHIICNFNFYEGNQNTCGFYIGHNTNDTTPLDPDADRISESEIYANSSNPSSQPIAATIQTVLDLNTNDRVFFIVQNKDASTDITVEFMKFVVTSLTAEKGATGATGSNGLNGVHNPIIISGERYTLSLGAAAKSTLLSVANRLDLMPYIPIVTHTSTGLSIDCSSAIAGSNARILVYSNNNGQPGTKIVESTNLSTAAIGIKTFSTSQTFTAGEIYWIGVHTSSTQTLRAVPVANMLNIGTPTTQSTTHFTMYRVTVAYGSAPTTYSGGVLTSSIANEIRITAA